jgi:hypothetical protein
MTVEVVLGALGIAGTLIGVTLGDVLRRRGERERWRIEVTRQAVMNYLRLATRLQVAIHEIALAAGGDGHAAAVAKMDRALVELNVEIRALELVAPGELSGKFWRNLGEIESSVEHFRDADVVRDWVARDPHALEGSTEVAIWLQGCINAARRHLGFRWKDGSIAA